MRIDRIKVRGEQQIAPVVATAATPGLHLQASYLVSGNLRGLAQEHDVPLTDRHIVELIFEDEDTGAKTTWMCNGDTLEDIFPEAAVTIASRGSDGGFAIPMVVQSPDAERGAVGKVLLKALNLFIKPAVERAVKLIAADLEASQLGSQTGLCLLDEGFNLRPFTAGADSHPYLLFMHGTASSTAGSFDGLMNTGLWTYICSQYPGRVLAFQHRSLTESPLQNLCELAKQLPDRATIDLITHSTGGLIGDLLCRYCNSDEHNRGFTEDEKNYLKNAGGHETDLAQIDEIAAIFTIKKIRIERYVRVACPAAGTVLAGKRLDNFLNVSLNIIGYGTGLAASPVYSFFKELIAAVAGTKNDTTSLPGLEAINPESAFIKVLNSPATTIPIDSTLTIISGNSRAALNLKGLLILASKLFYQQDNDLIVNTASMYLGAKRNTPVQYFFDDTGGVDHFHYFKNKRTNDAILQVLSTAPGMVVPGFANVAERLAMRGMLNLEGGDVFSDTVSGTRPIVVLLPGIMGSNLSQNGNKVWINYLKMLGGGLTDLDITASGIEAKSLIKTSYKLLADYLSKDYDVVTFPFDWRMELSTQAAKFDAKIRELMLKKQPIKIIGHSMGGVLVRDFIVYHPQTWDDLNRSAGFRLLFLGAPLGGSYRIPTVLFGQDAIINKLSKLDIIHTKKRLLKTFSQMPGLLSLLPHTTDAANDFAKKETWDAMAATIGDWPVPNATDLSGFGAYRDKTDLGMATLDYSNMVYIAGKDASTPCAYRIDDTTSGKELTFLSTAEGDQSVTWASGIPPQMIAKDAVYYVNVTHGALANEPTIFGGIADLLVNKTTTALSRTRPAVRGEEKLFKAPVPEDFDLSPQGLEKDLLGLGESGARRAEAPLPIQVSVSKGDLTYATYPLLAGHFNKDGILYAEKVIDGNLGGILSQRHRLGLYPGELNTSEAVFTKNRAFKGAVIAGLGTPGELTAFRLASTVEQAACNYILRYTTSATLNSEAMAQEIGISSLVIGCGYGGLSIENSVRAILQGLQNANEKMKTLHGAGATTIRNVEFIEQYEDRALTCFHALGKIEAEAGKSLNIMNSDKRISTLLGWKKRLPAEATESWWNRITVSRNKEETSTGASFYGLRFSASNGGAREEVRELLTSIPLIEDLLQEMSSDNHWTPQLAKTIFELLIPNDFKEQLKKQCNVNWIVDDYTAAIPWELLQDTAGNAEPLCVNAGMVRQMATENYRQRINAVTANTALVVADPLLDGYLPQLDGAREEGKIVEELLVANGFQTMSCINKRSPEILQAIAGGTDYRIIHFASHGNYNSADPTHSGIVIGDDKYISTDLMGNITSVPELVFVNCCYLGKTDGADEEFYQQHYKLAANIGTQLIQDGVKVVIAAGWAVDDAAAHDFTDTFYRQMFAGEAFGAAVQKARKLIFEKYGASNNTWGAYQCYGDPFYRLYAPEAKKEKFRYDFTITEEAEIELENLSNSLATGNYNHDDYLVQVAAIAEAIDRAGIRTAWLTELEALIYSDLYEYDMAVAKFEQLLKFEHATFRFSALERYCNIRAKKYIADYLNAVQKAGDSDQAELKRLQASKLKDIEKVIADMESLLSLGKEPTAERYNIMASTYKRKAYLSKTDTQREKAYKQAADYYAKALTVLGGKNSAYALANWYELLSVLVLTGKPSYKWGAGTGQTAFPTEADALQRLADLKGKLSTSLADADYWDLIANANISLCERIIQHNEPSQESAWDGLADNYRKVWERAGSKGKKLAELEHLELLADALTLNTSRSATRLMKRIQKLVTDLQKMI